MAATSAAARRSEAVEAKGHCRVGVPTDNVEKGDEVDSGSGSERARRAARRGTSRNHERQQGSGEVGGSVAANEPRDGQKAEASRRGQSAMASGLESKNYFSALAGEEMGEAMNKDQT